MNRILIIDDDEELCELVSEYLSVEGFQVEAVHDGESGLQKALRDEQDLVILDVMLPKKNGFDVLRELRQTSKTPVLMLTARGEDSERIVGLESGADDYLPKPFNPRELAARLRAILRRAEITDETKQIEDDKIKVDDVEVKISARSATKNGKDLGLTSVEFELLAMLLKNAGTIVKKEDLSEQVLERKLSPYDRSLDMHISNLRKKLDAHGSEEERIKTVRSAGYIYTLDI
ncbi:MAG TPA: response regulator transcription factor [Pyrinomonadaceae bacterium]|nr:response regulator transcription factor [Pyrinomonadaceae bacterium]